MKVLVGVYNQEKALVGAFSMIVKTDGSFAALICTAAASQIIPAYLLVNAVRAAGDGANIQT